MRHLAQRYVSIVYIGEIVLLKDPSQLRNVNGISEQESQRIKDFLQGAVYCWCKNKKGDWFSLRDLMGGDNFYWEDTPLIPLYEKHKTKKVDPWVPPVNPKGRNIFTMGRYLGRLI